MAEPCSVGRKVVNEQIGWVNPCPDLGLHNVILAYQGEILILCDNHLIDWMQHTEDNVPLELPDGS